MCACSVFGGSICGSAHPTVLLLCVVGRGERETPRGSGKCATPLFCPGWNGDTDSRIGVCGVGVFIEGRGGERAPRCKGSLCEGGGGVV